jgi:hypothetical protein
MEYSGHTTATLGYDHPCGQPCCAIAVDTYGA